VGLTPYRVSALLTTEAAITRLRAESKNTGRSGLQPGKIPNFAVALPDAVKYILFSYHGTQLPTRSPTHMLHVSRSNMRHSLHDLLHSMLHTCSIAHAN